MQHAGRVAIVTGAGQGTGGIGRTIARRLLAEGAKVVVSDLDEGADATARELGGKDVIAHRGNLAEEAAAQSLAKAALDAWGRIDILVNNAGGGIIKAFLEHTPDTLRETIARNLWTAIWCTRAVLPSMVERNYGRIVNIGADSIRTGLYEHAGYNAAKGGVHGMTTGLAREFAGYDITINTIAPSLVNTPRQKELVKTNPARARKFSDVIPKGRPAEPEEIAAFTSFIASSEAGFITGQVLSINGGAAML
jgi:2,3-dihydroxy-2,3-dihydro-p-cumate dehydrogenase